MVELIFTILLIPILLLSVIVMFDAAKTIVIDKVVVERKKYQYLDYMKEILRESESKLVSKNAVDIVNMMHNTIKNVMTKFYKEELDVDSTGFYDSYCTDEKIKDYYYYLITQRYYRQLSDKKFGFWLNDKTEIAKEIEDMHLASIENLSESKINEFKEKLSEDALDHLRL